MKGYVFALLLFKIIFARGAETICPLDSVISPCKCFEHTVKQIRCESTNETFNGAELLKKFKDYEHEFDYLYISNTKLDSIKALTFGKLTFKEIFIVGNTLLQDIDEAAFKTDGPTKTTVLSIRKNEKLIGDNIFKIARKFQISLKTVEFDQNKITTLPEGVFNGEGNPKLFQSLEYIRLDNQKDPKITSIPANAFKALTKLKQLSLDNNKINVIKDTAIDLNGMSTTDESHVAIFLNDNLLTDITEKQIVFDQANLKFHVYLQLDRNKIAKVKDGLFSKILSNGKGRIFLDGINELSCTCTEVAVVKQHYQQILLPNTVKCLKPAKVDLKDC